VGFAVVFKAGDQLATVDEIVVAHTE